MKITCAPRIVSAWPVMRASLGRVSLYPIDDYTHVVVVKRRYESAHRQEQARQTRRAVLAAAGTLFVDPGYAATPLTAVAAEAGGAPPTREQIFWRQKTRRA